MHNARVLSSTAKQGFATVNDIAARNGPHFGIQGCGLLRESGYLFAILLLALLSSLFSLLTTKLNVDKNTEYGVDTLGRCL